MTEKPRFSPPSVEDVTSYVKEKGYDMDPEKFWSYHESKGWVVGKAPMRSWRAAVLTWFRRDHPKTRGGTFAHHPGWEPTPDEILAEQGVDLEALRKAREAEKP